MTDAITEVSGTPTVFTCRRDLAGLPQARARQRLGDGTDGGVGSQRRLEGLPNEAAR